jgi:xanthine dehydrogenase YagS FAD-binding subunit
MRSFSHIDIERTDVVALLDPTSRPLAGGTDLLPLMQAGLIEPQRLVNLKSARDLRYIRDDVDGLHIGALTTLNDLHRSDEVQRGYGALAQAAGLAASPQLRNMATIGGNLLQQVRCWYYRGDFHCWLKGGEECQARNGRNEYHAIFEQAPCVAVHPSDPPAALVAFDAKLHIAGPSSERAVFVADLLQPPTDTRRTLHTLQPDELIMEIQVPKPQGRSVYLKAMDRAAWAYALVSVAVVADVVNGTAKNVRIVLGGVANTPIRATAAEALVEGQPLDDDVVRRAGEVAMSEAQPLEHNQYKLPLARNLVAQALLDIRE